MFPPMGLVGSPKKTAGFESTWLVTRPTALFSSASLKRSWRCRFSFCCRAARVPRPAYSALKCEVSESMIKSLTGLSESLSSAARSRAVSSIRI
ncbi:MAG: hypothetical protein BWY93_00809 [Euryarchaeota archaeon ADurb.BinA087]|nr:MAG: hypothetical protein BWY93_00809 [Euryarchaeota archaeon ADurb.BinA087]